MSDFVIAQRDFFTQAGVTDSPATVENTGRFENWTFLATSVTKVEGTADGSTYVDITALGTAVGTAGYIFRGMSFKQYRVTFVGTLRVSAN